MTTFTEDLAVTLSLTINNTAYSVPAGNIQSLDLNILPYGFDGEVSLVMPVENTTDTLFTPLTGNTLIEVSLQATVYINNTQGTVIDTGVTPTVSTFHRLDIQCIAAGIITMSFDGAAPQSFTVPNAVVDYHLSGLGQFTSP